MASRPSVFVSYAHEDAVWHDRLNQFGRLLGRAFDVEYWSDRSLKGSDAWEREIVAAMARARVAVLLVSQAFVDSDFISRVELPAIMAAWQTGDMRVLPIAVEAVALPEGHPLRHVQFVRPPDVPLASMAPEVWHAALSDVADRTAELMEIERRGKPTNLPYRSIGTLFKGREEFLKRIREAIGAHPGDGADPDPTAARRPVVVHGLGGIGKTRAAIEFAHRYAADYTTLLFVRANSPEGLKANLAALCGPLVLDLAEKDAREEEVQVAAALHWLRQHPGWFLILDNVDTEEAARAMENLLGQLSPAGQVLITSRISRWSSAVEPLALDVLAEADAASFLLERTDRRRRKQSDDAEQARTLAVILGQLPLALEQAGAMIETNRYTFAQYIEEWRSRHDRVLAWFDERQNQYPMSVAVTWQTSFEQITEPARRLLQMLAWFPSGPIPESLLDVPYAEASETDGSTDLHAALEDLTTYSLVTRADGPMFSVHRLVQDMTRSSLAGQDDHVVPRAVLRWLGVAFAGDPRDPRTWPALAPLTPHALACAQLGCEAGIDDDAAPLFNQLGVLFHARALYRDAEPLMRRTMAIDEASYGPEYPSVARDPNGLAQLLRTTNRLSEAEMMVLRALAIDEASGGPDRPDVARDLANLSRLFLATNRLSEAETLMRRALAIDEACWGSEHSKVAARLINLAALLQATNRLPESEPLLRRALAIYEQSLGREHPSAAPVLNILGLLLLATNRPAEAEPLIRRALAIYEASYSPEHPNVVTALNSLAMLLQETNRPAEAEPLTRRALAIAEAAYGPEHPNVVTALNSLAMLLQATNRPAEAEPLVRRALAIAEAAYGPEHPNAATALSYLAQLLRATNRLSEAEPLMRRALAICEQHYGAEHPEVATNLSNLANLLNVMNRPSEAEPLMRRALEIDEQYYGAVHPEIAANLSELARLLHATNRLPEAEPLMRRALAICEASYGPEHPKVGVSLNNLAELLRVTNRLPEAEPLMRRALAVFEASLGPGDVTVATCLYALAQLLRATDRLSEAEPLMRRALAIDEAAYGANDPQIANDLRSLANLFKAMNRPSEAEPLMRRIVAILVQFNLATGYPHPHLQEAANNYAGLLMEMGSTREEAVTALQEIAPNLFGGDGQ